MFTILWFSEKTDCATDTWQTFTGPTNTLGAQHAEFLQKVLHSIVVAIGFWRDAFVPNFGSLRPTAVKEKEPYYFMENEEKVLFSIVPQHMTSLPFKSVLNSWT